MPKRTDIKSILIVGAGPIVIGQACEFDYSGTQACKALKQEGYRIVLVNSNPATIMTDPDVADATYIEPITPEILTQIIEKERPDALLPTMGGQTALNAALSLERAGVLKKYGVEMIGARAEVIDKAEYRELFREAMHKIGLETPRSRLADAATLKRADRQKYKDEIARIEASHADPQERARVDIASAQADGERKLYAQQLAVQQRSLRRLVLRAPRSGVSGRSATLTATPSPASCGSANSLVAVGVTGALAPPRRRAQMADTSTRSAPPETQASIAASRVSAASKSSGGSSVRRPRRASRALARRASMSCARSATGAYPITPAMPLIV